MAFESFYVKGPAYGGLIRGVADAARLVLLHLNGGLLGETRLLSAASVAEMQRITPRGGKRDFGLGWFRAREANQKRSALVEHLGGGAGYWNVMRLYPEATLGVVMMGNNHRLRSRVHPGRGGTACVGVSVLLSAAAVGAKGQDAAVVARVRREIGRYSERNALRRTSAGPPRGWPRCRGRPRFRRFQPGARGVRG